MLIHIDIDEILDLIDVAAKGYGIKTLAFEMDKGESTLRNELSKQPGYKLGFTTALAILSKTKSLEALKQINQAFGLSVIELKPNQKKIIASNLLELNASTAKEYSELLQNITNACADRKITLREAIEVRKEAFDLAHKCMELITFCENIIKEKKEK